MKRLATIQVIHHANRYGDLAGGAAELEDMWNARTARYLWKYAGIPSVLIRPGLVRGARVDRVGSGVLRLRLESIDLKRLGRRFGDDITLPLASSIKITARLLEDMGYEPVVFLHNPRSINYLGLYTMWQADKILQDLVYVGQHHGARNRHYSSWFSGPWVRRKGLDMMARLAVNLSLHWIDCHSARRFLINYVINSYDLRYYREVCGARARFSTMGVDFQEVKPLDEEERSRIRERLGLRGRVMIYVGELLFGSVKGSDILVRLYKRMGGRSSGWDLVMISRTADQRLAETARRSGAVVVEGLPHHDTLQLIGASEVYVLTARSTCYWGGPGVAPMEAMAMNIPVISPTLYHLPFGDREKLGIPIPWSDRVEFEDLVEIFRKSLEGLENISITPREVAVKYFDWKAIVQGYLKDLGA